MPKALLKRHAATLKVLGQPKLCPVLKKLILTGQGSKQLIRCLSEIAYNVLRGNVPLTPHQKGQLGKHKFPLRQLGQKKVSHKKKVRLVQQKGGFLSALLAPLAALVGPLINRIIG
jgi:hypothetical protein